MKTKSQRPNYLLILLITLLMIGISELGARVSLIEPQPLFGRGSLYGELETQNSIWNIWTARPYRVIVNAQGFRNDEPMQDSYRILAIGDSFTFAPYVDNMDSWTAWLENALTENGYDAQVLNAGRSGATMIDYYKYLLDKGLSIDPDMVILQYYTNDIPDYAPCKSVYRRNDIEPTSPNTIYESGLVRALDRVTRQVNTDTGETVTQSDCHSGIESMYDDEPVNPDYYIAFQSDLIAIIDLLRNRDIPLIVVAIPDHLQIHYDYADSHQRFVEQILFREGYGQFIDLLPTFKSIDDIEALYLLESDSTQNLP
jgi:hypothetical protein